MMAYLNYPEVELWMALDWTVDTKYTRDIQRAL